MTRVPEFVRARGEAQHQHPLVGGDAAHRQMVLLPLAEVPDNKDRPVGAMAEMESCLPRFVDVNHP
jgi:hypothetical protein